MAYPFAAWDFGDSVYLDALVALADADPHTGAEFGGFAYGMTKAWVAHTSYDYGDHTAPGAAIVALWRRTGDPHLLTAATELARLWDRFPRAATAEAFLHTFMRHSNVAIDCAHFDGPFFAELASATGDERYAERAVYELGWRTRLLQNEVSGLFHHAFDCGRGHRSEAMWGRGQGWALLGLVETLRSLPTGFAGTDELKDRLRAAVQEMVRLQDSSGHWHTLVDDESSYLETSVTAFFVAAAIGALEEGLVDPTDGLQEAIDRAWQAVLAAVDDKGALTGVSGNTLSTLPLAGYREVARGGVYPWGQGALALSALAVARRWTKLPTDVSEVK